MITKGRCHRVAPASSGLVPLGGVYKCLMSFATWCICLTVALVAFMLPMVMLRAALAVLRCSAASAALRLASSVCLSISAAAGAGGAAGDAAGAAAG
eukprot:CAMPEP_0172808344 /NCGR_PEP_ID=MMETSP1075-20121228/7624_1 /TAXON_ID=2916 /ORGANISM="Ceratium fusus, Strain PA161109" /LENGTH=96 /DNA_ID=CAMNT_0013647485 /DNA_START=44 /DNA_END=334 /DNA_ORIENTATION=-